jgi:integrase
MQIIAEFEPKQQQKSNTNQLLTTETLLNRGMTVEECKTMCTHHSIDLREKIFFRIIYETQLRPFEVLNLQVEQWDRKQGFVTALKVKQKTKPRKGDHHSKDWLPSTPKTRAITPSTNELLREYMSNRKKGPVFINENEEMLSLEWFNQEISRYAKLLGIQRIKKYYVDGRTLKLVTCMALREAGERHHDNAGGSRKLSAVAADHTMQVKEKHYEKVGEDIEQITQSYQKNHPAWVEGW